MTRTNTSIAVIGLGDDGTIIAVAHRQFAAMQTAQMQALGKANHVLYDLKNMLPANGSDLRL
jgi:UDP-N-acetyl-D-glucosamine/UDP-N-acetyl-D-galactosamine dehydrogenase